MALFGDLTYDSRVRREAATLALAGYYVTLVCLDGAPAPDLPDSIRIIVRRPSRVGALPGAAREGSGGNPGRLRRALDRSRWLLDYVRNVRSWGRMAVDAAGPVDAWHVHDLPGLIAIAPRVASTPLIYDSHEIFLEAGTARGMPSPIRSLLRAYERRLVARVTALVTVNDSLASVFERLYRPRRVIAVHICPERWMPPSADPGLLRQAAGIPSGAPVILYHGTVGAGRGIGQLLEALLEPGLERAHLVVMGEGWETVTDLAADSRWEARAHVLPPVHPSVLLSWVTSADVGGALIQRTTMNHYLSTPNKVFECLASGRAGRRKRLPGDASGRPRLAGRSAGGRGRSRRPGGGGESAPLDPRPGRGRVGRSSPALSDRGGRTLELEGRIGPTCRAVRRGIETRGGRLTVRGGR